MRRYWILYWNELKLNSPLIFLQLFLLFMFFYFHGYKNIFVVPSMVYVTPFIIIITAFIVLPFMLTNSMNSEKRTKENHLLFSLPINRFTIMLTKYLALLSLVVILFGIVICTDHILPYNIIPNVSSVIQCYSYICSEVRSTKSMNPFFPFILFQTLLGIICVTEGFITSIKRYKRFFGIICFIICFLFSLWFITVFSMKTILFATALYIIGLFLFHKFSDI